MAARRRFSEVMRDTGRAVRDKMPKRPMGTLAWRNQAGYFKANTRLINVSRQLARLNMEEQRLKTRKGGLDARLKTVTKASVKDDIQREMGRIDKEIANLGNQRNHIRAGASKELQLMESLTRDAVRRGIDTQIEPRKTIEAVAKDAFPSATPAEINKLLGKK